MNIKVFVIDDSAVVRQTLQHLLQGDAELELMGSAPNPLIRPRTNPLRSHGPKGVGRYPAVDVSHSGDHGATTRKTPRAAKT